MITVKDIYNYIDEVAPFNTQLPYDNAGVLIGDFGKEVKKIGFCLDVTNEIVEKAVESEIDLIVSHHPVIFNKLSNVYSDSVVYSLIKNDIAVISAHTNYDCADGGVNDCLFNILGLTDKLPLYSHEFKDFPALGRIGTLPTSVSIYELAKQVKLALDSPDVRYSANCNNIIERVAVCGGAGSDLISDAIEAGADALITSEVKQHEWLYASHHGFALLDAGHFSTENIAIKPLFEKVAKKFEIDCEIISQCAPYKTV